MPGAVDLEVVDIHRQRALAGRDQVTRSAGA